MTLSLARELQGRTCIALDLDGVVYSGGAALEGAPEAVAELRDRGYGVVFTTNSSVSTRQQVADKLIGLGVPATAADVLTSGHLAAALVAERWPGDPTLVLGSAGLAEELRTRGVPLVEDPMVARVVVVGLDPGFDYASLSAALAALGRGARVVGCNRDASYPAGQNRRLPGCGPILAAVECAAGREADAVVGKPAPEMLLMAARTLESPLSDWVVVGDSVEADLAMAEAAGVPGLLVGDGARHRDLAHLVADWFDLRRR